MNNTAASEALLQGAGSPGIDASQCLKDFDDHLTRVQGLAPRTREGYCFWVRRFLARFCALDAPGWSSLRAEHVTTFVQQEASRLHLTSIFACNTGHGHSRVPALPYVFRGDPQRSGSSCSANAPMEAHRTSAVSAFRRRGTCGWRRFGRNSQRVTQPRDSLAARAHGIARRRSQQALA